MNYINLIVFIVLCHLKLYFGNATLINILTYSFDEYSTSQNYILEKEFNDYAEVNNLNVTVKFEVMIFENPSEAYENFKLVAETSLKKTNNHKKYDMYFYDNKYTNIYGPYLLDLKNLVPKEHVDIFNPDIIRDSCVYKDKLIGLPTYVIYEVLYSNIELLKKHERSIPKTWDELIDTCKYIMEKENDPELICYNGLFDESTQGLYSLYGFIYSFRDSKNSTYPMPQDQSFVNALKTLRKLKTEVASDIIFKSNENFTFAKLMNGKSIFLKYWFVGDPLLSMLQYNLTNLPGIKEGISTSLITGNNASIIKTIPEDKIEAALKVVDYFTSKEKERALFESRSCITPIDEILNDEESCKKFGFCDIIRNMQYTVEPSFLDEGPEDYKKYYQKYIYQYLYENQDIDETLKQIEDITKVYYITLDTDDSYIGLVFFILISVVSTLMLLSLIYVFMEKYIPFFSFLPDDLWIVTVLGSILILWTPIFDYGKMTSLKCHLKPLLLPVGLSLSLSPSIYKLITQFPEENKITKMVKNHKYCYILMNVLVDGIIWSISLIEPYKTELVMVNDGENFEKCNYSAYSIILILINKSLFIFLMLFLIFVEWNISNSNFNIKFILISLYINGLSIVLIFVFHMLKNKYYEINFLFMTINVLLISISNYFFFYGFRVFLCIIQKENSKSKFISNINEKFINNESQVKTESFDISSPNETSKYNETSGNKSENENENEYENGNNEMITTKTNFISRMINYHYTSNYTDADSLTSKYTSNQTDV